MVFDITSLIGIIGAATILIAFLMNQVNKWKNDSLIYDLLNLIGSVFLIIYALLLKSYPFLILNGVWALMSLKDVFIDISKKRN